jgi:hypothetical protein
MPLSKAIAIQNLKRGKKYIIEVQWNITNDLRLPTTYTMIGTFVQSGYVRGRTHSFDSGLQMLVSRSRYEATFNIDGIEKVVSSANKFYEIIVPKEDEIARAHKINELPLPTDMKKEISTYIGETRKLKYRLPQIK